MTRTVKLFLCQATMCIAAVLQGQLFADEPLPPPKLREIWSPSRQFCAEMEPKTMTTVVYRVETDGRRTRQWAMYGWFRVASLADDGEHLITGNDGINLLPLIATKDEPMIRFFNRGELINTVTLGELLKDLSCLRRTASHYLWGSYRGLDEKGRYTVETVAGKTFLFDVATGRAWKQSGEHAAAEAKALQSAEAWLALTDAGKYGESWELAADYLKNAIGKDLFVRSLAAARKPLGKLKSRELKSKQYKTSLPGAPDGKYVVIQFKTAFEDKESAIETVTPMLDEDGKWRVSGYYIR
jgi:hypothetical protein